MSVAIIDYHMGNLASLKNALDSLNIPSVITNDEHVIRSSKYIILPGVGSFAQGMKNIRDLNLDKLLTTEIIAKKKPMLGICLGMQLLAEVGFEPYENLGLGFIQGSVKKIEDDKLVVPHLGWNEIQTANSIFFEEFDNTDVYFIHSYHFDVKNKEEVASYFTYGEQKFVASIIKDNIYAMQFHPEKSQKIGQKMLLKFFEENA
jgi:glutamine amidotransferase